MPTVMVALLHQVPQPSAHSVILLFIVETAPGHITYKR